VDSTNVTAAQAADLDNQIAPMTAFLARLYVRMQKRPWTADDPLYVNVRAPQDVLHRCNDFGNAIDGVRPKK
jgi:hypothetical protein